MTERQGYCQGNSLSHLARGEGQIAYLGFLQGVQHNELCAKKYLYTR